MKSVPILRAFLVIVSLLIPLKLLYGGIEIGGDGPAIHPYFLDQPYPRSTNRAVIERIIKFLEIDQTPQPNGVHVIQNVGSSKKGLMEAKVLLQWLEGQVIAMEVRLLVPKNQFQMRQYSFVIDSKKSQIDFTSSRGLSKKFVKMDGSVVEHLIKQYFIGERPPGNFLDVTLSEFSWLPFGLGKIFSDSLHIRARLNDQFEIIVQNGFRKSSSCFVSLKNLAQK